MNEMTESLNIINQVIYKIIKQNKINPKTNKNIHNIIKYTDQSTTNKQNLKNNYNSMESLIKHFKYWCGGDRVISG